MFNICNDPFSPHLTEEEIEVRGASLTSSRSQGGRVIKSVFRVALHTLNHKLFGTNGYLKLPQVGYSERMGELCGSTVWKCIPARFLFLRSCKERQRRELWR